MSAAYLVFLVLGYLLALVTGAVSSYGDLYDRLFQQ